MDYNETMQQIERSKLFDRFYILSVLVLVCIVLIATLFFAFSRRKITRKIPLVVFVILICVVAALIFENVKLSRIREDIRAQDYVSYVGDFKVKYFVTGEEATTVLIQSENKEIQLTVATLAMKYLLSNVEEINTIVGTGEYSGEVVYAPRSHYVVKLVIDQSETVQ